MTVTHMEILGSVGEKLPLLPLDRTRDALASYCEYRWPVGRRKSVSREFDLTAEEARSVCEASASATTIDKIWQHPRGGWVVAIPVLGAVIGLGLDDFITSQRRKDVDNARRRRALVRDLRSLAADHHHGSGELGAEHGRERRTFRS